MTIQEFAALPADFVGTKEAAEILGCSRFGLTVAAKNGHLNIPHFFTGNRLKLSKRAILKMCGYRPPRRAPHAVD